MINFWREKICKFLRKKGFHLIINNSLTFLWLWNLIHLFSKKKVLKKINFPNCISKCVFVKEPQAGFKTQADSGVYIRPLSVQIELDFWFKSFEAFQIVRNCLPFCYWRTLEVLN